MIGMNDTDVIIEVLLRFTEPYLSIGETNYDNKAYENLKTICYLHDYCYDLIRENAELKGNEYSIVKAREKAIEHISESIVCMRDLLDEVYKDMIETLNIAIEALNQYGFAEWVANEIFSDDWELNKNSFEEIACRKLVKLGIVEEVDGQYRLKIEEKKK